jgi:hypothetical protein
MKEKHNFQSKEIANFGKMGKFRFDFKLVMNFGLISAISLFFTSWEAQKNRFFLIN